jgi:hypothetical protein
MARLAMKDKTERQSIMTLCGLTDPSNFSVTSRATWSFVGVALDVDSLGSSPHGATKHGPAVSMVSAG